MCQFNSFQLANRHNFDADDGNTYGFVVVVVHLVSANGSIVSNADLTWECVLPIQSEKKEQKVVINYVKLPPSLAQKHTNSHRIPIDFAENESIGYCLNKNFQNWAHTKHHCRNVNKIKFKYKMTIDCVLMSAHVT